MDSRNKHLHPHYNQHNRHHHHDDDDEELEDDEFDDPDDLEDYTPTSPTPKINPFASPELENDDIWDNNIDNPLHIVIIPKLTDSKDEEDRKSDEVHQEVEDEEEDNHQHFFSDQVHIIRPRWKGWWPNLAAMIAFAVDMSNFSSFPIEVARQGGVAYILVYFIILIFFVYPMLYLEVIVGQYFQTGMIGIWGISPIFRGLGAGIFYITFIIIAYVPINVVWASLFLSDAMGSIQSGKLPWSTCDNDWNSCKCAGNRIPECLALQKISNTTIFVTSDDMQALYTPAAEYYIGKILKMLKTKYEDPVIIKDITENGNWSIAYGFLNDEKGIGELITSHCAIAVGIYIVILLLNLVHIKYIGYVYTFTATFPLLILFLLFCRGITLEGAAAGLKKYMKPDFNKVLDLSVWVTALQATSYSVGAGLGGHIVMSSFNPLNHNVRKDAILCIIVDTLMSLLGCLVAFMFVGHVHAVQREPLPDRFPGDTFVFITFAEAFTNVSGSSFFASVFYFMIMIFCIDTQMVMFQALTFSLYEEYKRKYPNQNVSIAIFMYTVWAFAFSITLLSTTRGGYWPFTFLTQRGFGSSGFIFMFMESVLFAWIWGIEEVCSATVTIMGYRPGLFLRFCWKFMMPVILFSVIVYKDSIQVKGPIQVFGQSAPAVTEKVGEVFQWATITLMACYATYVFIKMAIKEKNLSWLQVLMLLISPEYEHDSIRENVRNAKRLTWRHYAFFRFEGDLTNSQIKELAKKWRDKMKGLGRKSKRTVTATQSGAMSDMGRAMKEEKGKKKKDKNQRAEIRKEEENAWEMWEKVKPHVDLEFDDEDEVLSPEDVSPNKKIKSVIPTKTKQRSATIFHPSKARPTKKGGVTKKKTVGGGGVLKGNNKVKPKD